MIAAGDRTAQQRVAQMQRRSGDHLIECETHRGFHTSLGSLHPVKVLIAKWRRRPFALTQINLVPLPAGEGVRG